MPVSKAEYIRNSSKELSTKELIELAATEGISLTSQYIYFVRNDYEKRSQGKQGVKKNSFEPLTKEEYAAVAKESSAFLSAQGNNLLNVGKFLQSTQDFSPAVRASLEKYITDAKAVVECAERMYDATVRRGFTHFEEQKEAWKNGVLKLNRREEEDNDTDIDASKMDV